MKATRSLVQRLHQSCLSLLVCSALAVNATEQVADSVSPEVATQETSTTSQLSAPSFGSYVVVTANPIATEAGRRIIERGGNAIDAMVTVQTVLGLVEPQSSGMGGGSFLVYYDTKSGKITTFDGRETAPAAIPSDVFMLEDGKKMGFFEAVLGGSSVGVPGTPMLLSKVHEEHGSLKWADLLQPAIEKAQAGFVVSPRMAKMVARQTQALSIDPDTAAYFLPKGQTIKEGSLLRNPAYAALLTNLKQDGKAFYSTDISAAIIDKVSQAKNPGYLAQSDFSEYRVIEREAICASFIEHQVCGMGPPSSGADTVGQILGISELAGLTDLPPESPKAWHLVTEASRLAFADRGTWLADPAFAKRPTNYLDKTYLSERAKLLKPSKSLTEVSAGEPDQTGKNIDVGSPERESTTHFVIVDKQGNIVSMTSSIEFAFGSHLMAHGMLLNNELTDFSFTPEKNGERVANRVQGGKRPRSSMSPTIVLKDGKPVLALGSAGGSRIIGHTANTIIRHLLWEQDIHAAINAPHIINRFGKLEIEKHEGADTLKEKFEPYEYPAITINDQNSGLHAVSINKQLTKPFKAGYDLRREGIASGL